MEVYRALNTTGYIYFTVKDFATGKDFVSGITFATGDVKYSLGMGGFNNVGILPSEIGSSGIYAWFRTTGESVGDGILRIVDQTPTKVWQDKSINITTQGRDCVSIAGNYSAANNLVALFNNCLNTYLQGGTPSKQVFRTNAGVATDDFYIGAILLFTSGNNQGVSRIVVDYDGTDKEWVLNEELPLLPTLGDSILAIPLFTQDVLANVNTALDAANTALSGVISPATGSLRKTIQQIGYICHNKKVESSSQQEIKKPGLEGGFATRSVAEDSGVTTIGELTTYPE